MTPQRKVPITMSIVTHLHPSEPARPPFVETSVSLTLTGSVKLIARTGGMGWLTGGRGIGKTYYFEHRLETDAARFGISVKYIVLNALSGKSPRAFAEELCGRTPPDLATAYRWTEAAMSNLIYPAFGGPASPSVLIIDEAQFARGELMSMLRGIWDSWEPERRAARCEGRAPVLPGLVMIGNRVFAQGSGVAKTEEYRRWADRLLIRGTLERPSVADCAAVAATFPCADAEARALLEEIGAKRSNLRVMERAYRHAHELAPAGQLPGAAEIKEAIETHRRMT
jgi:hypothetical protein